MATTIVDTQRKWKDGKRAKKMALARNNNIELILTMYQFVTFCNSPVFVTHIFNHFSVTVNNASEEIWLDIRTLQSILDLFIEFHVCSVDSQSRPFTTSEKHCNAKGWLKMWSGERRRREWNCRNGPVITCLHNASLVDTWTNTPCSLLCVMCTYQVTEILCKIVFLNLAANKKHLQ